MSAPSPARDPAPEPWQTRGAGAAGRAGGRLVWVDLLRGAALIGMVVYHAAWDLHAFGITATDPGQDPGWLLLGRGIASVFLALSGFGLSLAVRQGASVRAMAARLGRIAGAAALVSVATWATLPEAPIWFGILHCIAVTNAIALAMRTQPGPVLLAAAAGVLAAPVLLHGLVGPGWAWTGLAADEPATLDFRPVLPWLAPVLFGTVLGRTRFGTWPGPGWTRSRALRPLAWTGRRSLLVYLVHQPLMAGSLAVLFGLPPRPEAAAQVLARPEQAAAFLQRCRDTCVARGEDRDVCTSTCHCVLTAAVGRAGSASARWPWSGPAAARLDSAVALCRPASTKPQP